MSTQLVFFKDLGLMDYKTAFDYQESLLQENVNRKAAVRNRVTDAVELMEQHETQGRLITGTSGAAEGRKSLPDTQHYLLLVEHPPVYTLGKSGKIENVLINEEMRSAKGVQFFRTNRGGDITFHGPQQIVGYPILDLEKFETDIGKYLRNIEEVTILTLAEYGIEAGRSP